MGLLLSLLFSYSAWSAKPAKLVKPAKLKCVSQGKSEKIILKDVCVGDKVYNETAKEYVTITELTQNPDRYNPSYIQTSFKVKNEKNIIESLHGNQVIIVDPNNCIKDGKENHCPGTKFYNNSSSQVNTLLGYKFAESFESHVTPVVKNIDGQIDYSADREIIEAIKFSRTGFISSWGDCTQGTFKIEWWLRKCAKLSLIGLANSRCKDILKENFKPIKDVPSNAITYVCKDGKDKDSFACEAEADVKCEALDQSKLAELKKLTQPNGLETRVIYLKDIETKVYDQNRGDKAKVQPERRPFTNNPNRTSADR
jgi:hypothetical protein